MDTTDKHTLTGVQQLLEVMQALRTPETGCPWDLQQDMQSLTRFTLEEVYELIDAIEAQDHHHIKEELGDVMFHLSFYSQLAQEQSWFNFNDVAETVSNKLIYRHPHVFEQDSKDISEGLKQGGDVKSWEARKQEERNRKNSQNEACEKQHKSFFSDIPQVAPALISSVKIQKRVAAVGFDWPDLAPVYDKVLEELDEVKHDVEQQAEQAKVEEEIGDLLFAVTNLARHLDIDPETALRRANKKFMGRFEQVKSSIEQTGLPIEKATLDEMESMWQKVKKNNG